MKILILNHCSHNKGDNSVLYYLIECLRVVTGGEFDLGISCSDGRKPFWLAGRCQPFYWPGGRFFKSPDASLLTNAVSRLRFLLMRKVLYPVFLRLYAAGRDGAARLLASLCFGRALMAEMAAAEVVICTGGHHISNVLEKNCINPQLVALALSTLYGKKPLLWSQSVGPLDGCPGYVEQAIARIFDACEQIYVRDDLSVRTVQQLSGSVPVKAPDAVFISAKLFERERGDKSYVACAVYTAGINDASYLKNYQLAWAKLCKQLEAKGLSVVFVPMQYKGYGGDERPFLKAVVESCNSANITYLDQDLDPKATLQVFNRASFVIGHKTHSIIYGLALARPTIAVAYHEKTRSFMGMFGFDQYVFDDVIGNEEAISALISADTAEFQHNCYRAGKKNELLADELLVNMKRALNLQS